MSNASFEEVVARLRAGDGDNEPARVVARIATLLGAWHTWTPDFIDEVGREVSEALASVDLPPCNDHDDERAHPFWGERAVEIGWLTDAEMPTHCTYLATINVPGYLPWDDDPPTFDTAREAWDYLLDRRRDDEDEAIENGHEEGYSVTKSILEQRAQGNWDPGYGTCDEVTGEGTVTGLTPGGRIADLGLAYTVTIVQEEDQ